MVLGSGELVRQLLARNLIDEIMLQIHPLVLGDGIRLFEGDGRLAKLRSSTRRPRRPASSSPPTAGPEPSGGSLVARFVGLPGSPTSIGLLAGSSLHSNQPPS